MNKEKNLIAFILLLSLMFLYGCTPIGEKGTSMTIIYAITTLLSLLLLIGYCVIIKNKEVWFYVLFTSVFVVNAGYLALASSETLNEALFANRIAYLGSVFLPLSILMTIIKVSKLKHKKIFTFIMLGISLAVFLIAASPGYSDIYYKSVTLGKIGGVSVLEKEYGPWHNIYLFYLVGHLILMILTILHAVKLKKIESVAHVVILFVAVLCNICVWLLEQLVKIDFEFLSVSYIISELFLLCVYLMIQHQEKLIASLKTQSSSPPDATKPKPLKNSAEFIEHCNFVCAQLPKLTPTERAIYDCYLEGMGTKDVLNKLSIMENTLKFHNKNLYGKLGVSSRKQLVEYAKAIQSRKQG